jgi:hypothetical protein
LTAGPLPDRQERSRHRRRAGLWPLDDRRCWGPDTARVPGGRCRRCARFAMARMPKKSLGDAPRKSRSRHCDGSTTRRSKTSSLRWRRATPAWPTQTALAGDDRRLRHERWEESRCAQTLRIGRYAAENSSIARLVVDPGPPRRDLPRCPSAQSPEKLRTILPHPIARWARYLSD